ncbi:hypothetical protein F5148DRAFT_739685 [Russula earlei]|uniref:Uncharacterized protein n=1 Tax=Russula earlei TaxID=71964 RepID=A0ACC0UDZ1_9AGAM|nr:hypothetical protein F5148DRAFT_739685 [Russula earlei]
MLPATFQAPHLRVLLLSYVSLPLGSPLLSTATGLTALEFKDILPSAHFPPSYLVARLSSLPQLECLSIGFKFADTTRAIESHPSHLVGPLVTLPSLRLCFFEGIGTYLEGFLARIRTPLLESLRIRLFNQLTFSFPHLLRLINTTENFRFSSAQLFFFQGLVGLTADRPEGDIQIIVGCRHIDWQVSAATQIFSALVPALSVVERLVLHYEEHDLPSEWDDDVRRTGWRDLLTPFTSVKDLHVDGGLIQELSRSLRTEGEESSLGLLPELKELIYYKDGDPSEDPSEAFASFINARQIEGHPVTVIPHPPSSFSFI